jgi:hypothetical protein
VAVENLDEGRGAAETLRRFVPGTAELLAAVAPRDRDAFWAIVELTPVLGRPPVSHELAKALGVASVGRVGELVHRLRRVGLLSYTPEDVFKSRLRLPFASGCCAACGCRRS